MSEQTQSNQNLLVIGLAVVAVLLVAIVGVIVYQQSAEVPAVTATPATTAPTAPAGGAAGAMGGAAAGATGGQAAAPTDVDPKEATKVKGDDLKGFVEAYYKACEKGDWEAAYNALPSDKKAGNSPEALKEQVTGYGVKSFTVTDATVEGDNGTVKADQVTTSYGTFENTWTFIKKGDTWYVSSKAVTGMK